MTDPNLVTTCNFNGRNYFIKMHVDTNILELVITDKQTGEDWQCCYEASYIENITQKTGNFKQFKIFTAMLKSGLLKTSNSVYLDLLTFNDLDALRNNRIRGLYSTYHLSKSNNNRRYLILTYTAEFDRIHYPIPLEYCGPPDPLILQQTINKLEDEITYLKEQIKLKIPHKPDSRIINSLQKRVVDLAEENQQLKSETKRLTMALENRSNNKNQIQLLQSAIKNLEKSVLSERKSHHELVDKLRKDKLMLTKELEKIKESEKSLLSQLKCIASPRCRKPTARFSDLSRIRLQSRSPSPKTDPWPTMSHNDYRPKKKSNVNKPTRKSRKDSRTPSPINNQRAQVWKSQIQNKIIPITRTRSTTRADIGAKGDTHRSMSPRIYREGREPTGSQPASKRSLRPKLPRSKHHSDSESSAKEIYQKPCKTKSTRSGSASSRGSIASSKHSKHDLNEAQGTSLEAIMNRLSCSASPRKTISKTSDLDRNFSSLENRISYLQKIVDDSLHVTI